MPNLLSLFYLLHKKNRNIPAIVFLCCWVIGLAGCATTTSQPIYDWGYYQDSLKAGYIKNDKEKMFEKLSNTVARVEANNIKIAPGIYAEYGFLLYQRGEPDLAIKYFMNEAEAFPESGQLMQKIIEKIKQQKDE